MLPLHRLYPNHSFRSIHSSFTSWLTSPLFHCIRGSLWNEATNVNTLHNHKEEGYKHASKVCYILFSIFNNVREIIYLLILEVQDVGNTLMVSRMIDDLSIVSFYTLEFSPNSRYDESDCMI
ncbi:hypothetical protein OCU04_001065 [Sclerotinia nivalis]|uniref:Uncharacterized protein n=1 Tax=Sclerotinia nivalis TaxID=352851 RepID=A0A9X0AXC7_9HELO|nr:hypothetical protein OCU04_001065 [Sclerotinia nivalis]